ncbi:type IX secretion system outer membrane channel protein PorV [Mucilaginibacter sp. KACC 22063]|uniref:type IX secretion system outer membrane channel protein PorV n=1 Tax=Mucilaginibacter sp. KACC 22063 TaxID=3025666 RepID=UPI002365ABE7|nr:type IX secretion system outer membrane channel protein PorV [Mucilaginibacter sp. KACC 22063]WDF55112.1 type IX secretion system outer membrane channel protein PorV [Mucilaginibacter sp. KACC 22063]
MKIYFPLTLRYAVSVFLTLSTAAACAQTTGGVNTNGSNSSALVTGVPFLNITPDSRSGAMGDAGVALSPDVNSTYWNPAKLTFIENNDALSASYSPWLHHLVPDVSLSYLSYAHKLNDRNSIGASIRYFNLGSIDLVDLNQQSQGSYTPNEFSIDGSFSRKFGNNFSLGLTVRYIHSSLYSNISGTSAQLSPANGVAADVSLYYRKPGELFGKQSQFAFGTNISNIGPRISYGDSSPKYYLPTNLKLGVAENVDLDDLNRITVAFDINKLLVPTPPIRDSDGNIIKGKSDDRSVPSAIFGSFSDAPGGFSEELKEISFSPGVEYWYNRQFALRAGYFYENPSKGNRQYLTLGAGLKYDIFNLDFAYLAASQQKSPLANTLRFTLLVNFESGKKK